MTSTSTPGSREMEVWQGTNRKDQCMVYVLIYSSILTICLTISLGECKSINRLWIRNSYRSQVLEPSPQGDFRVVCERTLVGRRTGPLTRSCLSLDRETKSEQTENCRKKAGQLLHSTPKRWSFFAKTHPFPNSWHSCWSKWFGSYGFGVREHWHQRPCPWRRSSSWIVNQRVRQRWPVDFLLRRRKDEKERWWRKKNYRARARRSAAWPNHRKPGV